MTWRREDPQGNEAAKIKYDIVPYTRGRGLDLGCGPHKAFPHFTGVDNGDHARRFGWQFKPDVMVDTCEKLSLFADDSMDFVFSSHLLEHITECGDALREWWRVIKPGGYLLLYLPHKEFYPNIGEPGSNPDHKHDFVPNDVIKMMKRVAQGESGFELVENENRNEGREYSFYQVYRKREDGQVVISCNRWTPPGKKSVCIVRYGGFGDMIQASSIFPHFHEQGYHVVVMTTPRGKQVIENDPNVDDFVIQDQDQVPNVELGLYWKVWETKFDRFVNLSESVEGALLAMPGRPVHSLPDQARHRLMDINYLEFTHTIAAAPLPPRPMFYPSDADYEWALGEMRPFNGRFLIMWALAGSSVHKAYPHMDNVIARILLNMPEATIIMVGDPAGQVLEAGWEKEKRVIKRSGKWSIRQTLTMARQCDLVIGPETGVLNAVSFCESVGKIVFLSHSSAENLTKGWPTTDAIAPAAEDAPCYPCHRLHYDRTYCHEWKVPVESHPISQDPVLLKEMTDHGHVQDGMFHTGAALCAASIIPDRVCDKVKDHYERWRAGRAVQKAG